MSENGSSSGSKSLNRDSRVAVSLGDLLKSNTFEFETNADDDEFYEDDTENRADMAFGTSDLLEHVNFDCIEASDPSVLPFEELATKMTDVWPDGKVKKRILKPGSVTIPEDAAVRVHYNCYTEMDEVPFDSSYQRSKQPIRFQLGAGSLFLGFEIALQSMTVGEKSEFLIHPDLAFGALGSPGRIPPSATVMLIAEIHRLDLTPEEAPLSVQDRNDFAIVYERAKRTNSEANSCVKEGYLYQAVGLYKRAERLLLGCSMNSDEQEAKFNRLLLKIYSNMAVCYNSPKMNLPKKTCIAVRKAFETDPTNAAKNPKFFYNRGVALMALAEYSQAGIDLRRAQRLLPEDEDIKRQLESLEKKKRSYEEFEKDCYSTALGIKKTPPADVPTVDDVIDDDCKAAFSRLLEDLAGRDTEAIDLTSEYTSAELEWLKTESGRLGLMYLETEIGPNRYKVNIMKKRSL